MCGYCNLQSKWETVVQHTCLNEKGSLILDNNNIVWCEKVSTENNSNTRMYGKPNVYLFIVRYAEY